MLSYRDTLVTAPTIEPLSLEDVKLNSRIDGTADDPLIESLIVAAREYVEQDTRRSIITQTRKLELDRFYDEMELPYPPLQSVTSVKYIDSNGTQQTLASSVYTVETGTEVNGVVRLAYNQSWPTIRDQRRAVEITYVAGYGASWESTPEPLRVAMLALIGHWYENREAVTMAATPNMTPMLVNSILNKYRISWL